MRDPTYIRTKGELSGGLKVSSFLKRIFRVPRATEQYSVPPTSRCHFAARLYRARGLRKCSYEGWRGKVVVRGRLQARVVSARVALRLAQRRFAVERSRDTVAGRRKWNVVRARKKSLYFVPPSADWWGAKFPCAPGKRERRIVLLQRGRKFTKAES